MKQSQKKKLAVLLITAMLFTLLPAGAFAADTTGNEVKTLDITQGDITINATGYTVGDATTETDFTGNYKITGSGASTGNRIVVTGGEQNITLDNVSISSGGCAFALQNGANVTLNLVGENTLQSGGTNAGIHVPAGTALTIKGDGNLKAQGGTYDEYGGAGIGGAGDKTTSGSFGTITLQGTGTITATGGKNGAGIGGGYKGEGGTIEICSGTVNAHGGSNGACIGGGQYGAGGTIIISGGIVKAIESISRSNGAAGIGGGYWGPGGGTILISGGEVTAKGNSFAAGIGSGQIEYGGTGSTIVITGGKVTATGGTNAAGIGGSSNSVGDTIFISGSTVTANSGSNADNIGGSHIVGKKDTWKGIVIGVGTENVVHGNPTLPADFTIPVDQTITIAAEQTVTIPEGKTLTNYGKIINNGTIINEGAIHNYGIIEGTVSGNVINRADVPTEGSVQIDYTAETITYDENTLEANANSNFADTTEIATDSSISDYIGKTIYVRVKETDTNLESLPLEVKLERPAMPAGLQSTSTSFAGVSDGIISGVSTDMEYKAESAAEWKDCPDNKIEGLSAGTYLVRVKATDSSFASEPATVVVAAGAERIWQLHMKDIIFTAKQGETVTEQKIFITNTGNSAANITSLTVDNTKAFELFGSGKVVEAGTTLSSYTIQPLANLPVGEYKATLTLEYDGNATTTSAVSFTVTKSEKPVRPSTGGSGGFSGSYNYPVKADDVDGATVSFDKSNAVAGEKVTITVTPDSGKRVDEVIVTDEDNEVIAVTKVGDNKYSFIMPEGAVKVAVTTEKADYDTRVVLQIGNRNVVNDNQTFTNDVAPVIVGDRTMVPIRVITEALGGVADWNEAARTVTLTIDGKVLRMTIDQTITGFDAAPVIINSRTYVPIRYVAEALGANVEWLADTQQIIIEK